MLSWIKTLFTKADEPVEYVEPVPSVLDEKAWAVVVEHYNYYVRPLGKHDEESFHRWMRFLVGKGLVRYLPVAQWSVVEVDLKTAQSVSNSNKVAQLCLEIMRQKSSSGHVGIFGGTSSHSTAILGFLVHNGMISLHTELER